MGDDRDANPGRPPTDLSDTDDDKCDDAQLKELRTEAEHHEHHARGDIGGEYHAQPGGAHPHEVGREALGTEGLEDAHRKEPIMVVVMGVSGCGKSTLGEALAGALRLPFVDADALHPQTNVDKMARGEALTDADRAPWLARVRAEAVRTCRLQERDNEFFGSGGDGDGDGDGDGKNADANANANGVGREKNGPAVGEDGREERPTPARRGIVVGCSALKRTYRDVLRGHTDTGGGAPDPDPNASSTAAVTSSPAYLPAYFVHIRGTRDKLLERMEHRKGHFMKAGMLDGQLATLEAPEATGEPGVVVVDLEAGTEAQVREAVEGLRRAGADV